MIIISSDDDNYKLLILWHQPGDSAMRVVKQPWQLDDADDNDDDGGEYHFYCDYFSGIERLGHEGRKDMGRLGSWMQPHIDRIGEQVGQVGWSS